MMTDRHALFNGLMIVMFFLVVVLFPFLCGCGGGGSSEGSDDDNSSDTDTTESYVILAWNDVGMHTMNSTYGTLVISPPDNNLWAQVILVGDPPVVTTSGLTVEYSIENNTSSADKTTFGQFWDHALALFGIDLSDDVGLFDNGLSGEMTADGDHFIAEGIPATPIDDDGIESPYQVAVLTVKDSGGTTLATTQATLPVSAGYNCTRCHETDTVTDIEVLHDADTATTTLLTGSEPVLCISCHDVDNNLGDFAMAGNDPSSKDLATAMHEFHSGRTDASSDPVACEDCHPDSELRSTVHADEGYDCEDCHGTMATMETSPSCATTDCHEGVYGVEYSVDTYRYSTESNHGGLYCASCHQTAHALTPSDLDSDNYQALQYQDSAMALGDCRPCHHSSIEKDVDQFNMKHVGSNARESTCNICHTDWSDGVTTEDYPHQYSWSNRE